MNRRAPLWIAGGVALTLAAVALVSACTALRAGDETVTVGGELVPSHPDYNWDVRPILSQNCFRCHGQSVRKAGLRLDVAAAAHGDLPEDHGKHALVAGNPRRSELFKRITTSDVDERMPPADSHLVLSKHDVAVIETWIKQGAKYEEHWAYLTPKAQAPRKTAWTQQAVNPIDNYVYDNLARRGLAPSAEADRETLINRVNLDLTGLPPTLQQVDAFVGDKDPKAYEKLVDRLLSSRAYAERQATVWLDVARYADSDGFLNDTIGRFQYPYRDWVISAFQRNIPYDQFVTWQLAGDKLPHATPEQILATAFVRAGKKSDEGGITDEEYRVEYVNERSELVGKAFLGLTVGCAKCHDHKYDVISQADYYSLGGFFNSMDERGIASGAMGVGGGGPGWGPTLDWPSARQSAQLAVAQQAVNRLQAAYDKALATARTAVQPAVQTELQAVPKTLQASLDQSTRAYYPMETVYKASFDPLLIENNPPRGAAPKPALKPGDKPGQARPAGLVRVSTGPAAASPVGPPKPPGPRVAADDLRAAIARSQEKAGAKPALTPVPASQKLLVGLTQEQLVWTPNLADPKTPGAINNLHVINGPPGKGKALLIDDTVAFANMSLGQYERTEPFTLDVWVKLRTDKPYDDVSLLYNADRRGAGYELALQNNVLSFNLRNTAPYDMVEVGMTKPLPVGRWLHLTATYDGSSHAKGAKLYLDGQPAETEILHDQLRRSIHPRGGTSGFGSYTGLSFGRQFGMPEFNKGGVDELRIFDRALTPLQVAYLHDKGAVAKTPASSITEQLTDIAVEAEPNVIQARAALKAAIEAQQAIYSSVPQMGVAGDRMKVRPTYVLDHGNFDQHLKPVPVQALGRVFGWKASYPRDRLGLAQWLFDPKNPLTARVYVNRLWQGHFGTGIVDTVEDFGTQGSNPTNPALLDYLALEFQRSGWDMRHMHRLMVMSATYRQSSNVTRDNLQKDPRNIYLERGPRYRLPAEIIRDNALLASGLLVDRPAGDSVFAYQPQGVWDATGVGPQIYPDQTLVPADELHRRSMYTYVKRNAHPPAMAVFDFADRNVSTVARKISNTPLQALVLLNDPEFTEAYRKLAERAIRSSARPEDQIVTLFRLATRRHPTAQELATLVRYREGQSRGFAASPQDATQLLKTGWTPSDPAVDQAGLAAMTLVAAVIMNSPDAYSLR